MKKSFALRVDSEVYDAIERWAADEFRSTNGQIEWILSEALKKARRYPKKKTESGEQTPPPFGSPSLNLGEDKKTENGQ